MPLTRGVSVTLSLALSVVGPSTTNAANFLFLTNAYGLIIDWHGLFPVKSTCAMSKVYVHTQCAVLNVSVLNASNVCELLVIQPPLPRRTSSLSFVFKHALPPAATGVAIYPWALVSTQKNIKHLACGAWGGERGVLP